MTTEIKNSDIHLEEIIQSDITDPSIKEQLMNSDLIFLPNSFLQSKKSGSFASETSDIVKFAHLRHPDLKISLYRDGSEKQIDVLHSSDVYLPIIHIFISSVAIPIVVNLLTDYIKFRFRGNPDLEKQQVKCDLLIEDKKSGVTKNVHYEGAVSGLPEIRKILNEDDELSGPA